MYTRVLILKKIVCQIKVILFLSYIFLGNVSAISVAKTFYTTQTCTGVSHILREIIPDDFRNKQQHSIKTLGTMEVEKISAKNTIKTRSLCKDMTYKL